MNETFMKERPVLPLLLEMALPNIISMLVNSLYNIVDSLFVARISEDAMTALSLVYPVQNFVAAVAIGFGVGINAMVALYLGAGDRDKAEAAATHGVLLSVLHGILFGAGGAAIMPTFLRLFTSDETLISLGTTYSSIVLPCCIFHMLLLAYEKIFQAVGMMKLCMVAMLCGCVTNIILDPIMIFGLGPIPAMGIAGAALATGIGQFTNLLVFLIAYARMEPPVRLRRKHIGINLSMDAKLYAIGIPAILNMALPSLLVTVLNSLLAAYSQCYVTVLGIYYKLQTFLYLPANGIVQGMRPLVSYNYGAKEFARVKKFHELTLFMCIGIMSAGTAACLFASQPLMSLFTSTPETLAIGQTALRIICLGFIISSVSIAASGVLEALGKGVQSLVISLCRYTIVILPLAALLCHFFGADGVWHAFWLTEVISALVAHLVYKKSVSYQ